MTGRIVIAIAALVCLTAVDAWGANSVLVESRTVAAGAEGVVIGVYIENDVDLASLIVPLEFRSVSSGAFTSEVFIFSEEGRLSTFDAQGQTFRRLYGLPSPLYLCGGTIAELAGEPGTIPEGFFQSPDAVMWAGFGTMLQSPLPAGSDGVPGAGTPSLTFTFDVTCQGGVFEIDTCCTAPANHLLFVTPLIEQIIVPAFTKGVVTVTGCSCLCDCRADPVCDGVTNAADVAAAVDIAFRDDQGVPDPGEMCPYATTDADCSGTTDVLDIVRFINVAFRGGDPAVEFCDPCAP